jgi:serine protease Do
MSWITLFVGVSLTLVQGVAASSWAAPLTGEAGKRWLAIASSKDLDTAIGIAGIYAEAQAKVVSSQSGWFAVVLGPYTEASVTDVLKVHKDIGPVPKDARLSKGDTYVDQVWEERPWSERRALITYDAAGPARFSQGELNFEVSMTGNEDDPGPAIASAKRAGQTAFSFTTSSDFVMFGADAGLLALDPTSLHPQLVFTRFTGGAHCCTQTWIATQPKSAAGWTLVDGGILDGGGYGFEDLDGDGTLEIRHVDNSFLYAFDSYAGSFAPVRIKQLRGNQLIDVSNSLAMKPILKRDLARMEFEAKLAPDLWKSNGFLAGWVAAKQRLGLGEDAWQTALENLDTNSDFGPQTCKTGKPVEGCDLEDLERVPIGKALAEFLNERDYGELPPIARALLK